MDALGRRRKVLQEIRAQKKQKAPDYTDDLRSVSKQVAKNNTDNIPTGLFDKAIAAADDETAGRLRQVRDNVTTQDDIQYFKKVVKNI